MLLVFEHSNQSLLNTHARNPEESFAATLQPGKLSLPMSHESDILKSSMCLYVST